jgi:hypothetical protein
VRAWYGWTSRLRRVVRRDRFEREMAEEMRTHLEYEAAAHRARGDDEATARRRAAIAFGPVAAFQEEARDSLAGRWLGRTVQDLRYGLRLLRRAPGFSLVVIGTLAVGIGANVAIFSALDAVLLRPLPYPQPDRLVQVFETHQNNAMLNSVSGGAYADWRQHGTSFEALTLVGGLTLNLRGSGAPDRLPGREVTHEFTRVLGIQPLVGRGFLPDDERPGGRNDVVISPRSCGNRGSVDGRRSSGRRSR